MMDSAHRFLMSHTLELARKGLGKTSPNPMVGCVVAKEGVIVGRGFHPKAGEPHAEVFALEEAGERARGADLYVNLEPCSHQGRTPPCADAIIKAGISRVFCAMKDPNPLVAGQGISKLECAGIEVHTGLMGEEAMLLNEAFCLSIVKKRPFIHLKLAATLDGRIATQTGLSKWITSEPSRYKVHQLRSRVDGVMVGVNTANADDPRLSVRLDPEREEQKLRIILDPMLRVRLDLSMFHKGSSQNTLVVCGPNAGYHEEALIEKTGATVMRVGIMPTGQLDIEELASRLYKAGHMELLLEGGSYSAKCFLKAGLVDRCHFFYGPLILGGGDGIPMFAGQGAHELARAVRLEGMTVSHMGPDVYVTGRVAN